MKLNGTYAKLKDGSWGLRVIGRAAKGDTISVKTKAGAIKSETVSAVIWTGRGSGREANVEISLCTIAGAESSGGSRRGKRECITGGNCSSFGSGKSCGAEDCDGY